MRHNKRQRIGRLRGASYAKKEDESKSPAQRSKAIREKPMKKCNKCRMTEFRKAKRRHQVRRRILRFLAVVSFATFLMAGIYSFASEGISGRKDIGSPSSGESGGQRMRMQVGGWKAPEECLALQASSEETVQTPLILEAPSSGDMVCLGEFEATGYCACDICCGKKPVKLTKLETVPRAGYTVAVDPEVIPLGSSIVVDGVTYKAEDIGHAIKGKSLDIFFASHEEAIKFGRQKLLVYVKQSL